MKKYIKNIILFFSIIAVIDFAFGKICYYLNSHAKGGGTKKNYYIAKECNEDLLVFGSSHALHHYVSSILSDTLGIKVYNCGCGGNGIILSLGQLVMILQRYTPKIIVYDWVSGFDFEMEDNTKYLAYLKRHYDIQGVSEIFEIISPIEKFKMVSNLYRYSYYFLPMFSDYFNPRAIIKQGGYQPLYDTINYEPKVKKEVEQLQYWDPMKKECMIQFVKLCKEHDIKLIFACSPNYNCSESRSKNLIYTFAKENDIPILYHCTDTIFLNKQKYFKDSDHLNDKGARLYTTIIAKELKELMFQK